VRPPAPSPCDEDCPVCRYVANFPTLLASAERPCDTFKPISKSIDDRHRSVIVAVVAVRMVKMPIYKIVDVIAVRHRLVSTTRAMYVIRIVSLASMCRRAAGRVGVANLQGVLFDLAVRADVMEVTIVQVVHVVAVLQAGVFAVRAVLVVVIGVQISHVKAPYLEVDSSIACMTPLVTRRDICSSASA